MSCLENDKIWDSLRDAYEEEKITLKEYMEMTLEGAFEFLMKEEKKEEKID